MGPLWSADPLGGVVVWGSAGIIAWVIVSAFVGSVIGSVRDLGRSSRPGTSASRRVMQHPRRPSQALQLASRKWQPAR